MAYRNIIDLKRSIWDKKKSDPKKGQYALTKIVYYKLKDFQDGYIHPYRLKWCKYSEKDYPRPFAKYQEWMVKYKNAMSMVLVGDDYVPEGVYPDAEGKYVDGDLVLVKIPIELHMAERKRAVDMSERQASGMRKQFQDEMRQVGADIPEQWTEERARRMREDIDVGGI